MSRAVNNKPATGRSPIDDLCCEIYQGDYVLVIGGDVVLREGLADGDDNKTYFDRRLDNYLRDNEIEPQTIDERKEELSDFLRNEYRYDIDSNLNPHLAALLATRCFRVVLTTTCDSYLELLMRRIWGDELRVINIYDNRDKGLFGNYSEYDIVPPTLVYVMGKADTAMAKFAYTEDDMIELFASRWLDSANKPRNLINYVGGKKVLGIGCKYDDWEFRFFWYSLRQNLRFLHGDVAISLDVESSESDRKLARYLKRKKVNDKGDSRRFLSLLAEQLGDPDKFVYERMAARMQSGGVFLSYAFEDFGAACQICRLLQERGFSVWFDNRQLKGGDRYDLRISDAISQCRIFVPLLSGQTAADLAARQERYYMHEWQQIAQNSAAAVIPLTLPGFDIRREREQLPEPLRSRTIVDWGADGAAALVEALLDKLR